MVGHSKKLFWTRGARVYSWHNVAEHRARTPFVTERAHALVLDWATSTSLPLITCEGGTHAEGTCVSGKLG